MNSSFRIKIALTSPHISQYHPESEVVLLPEAFLVGSEAKISLLWPKGHKLEGDNGWMCLPSVKLTWLAGKWKRESMYSLLKMGNFPAIAMLVY